MARLPICDTPRKVNRRYKLRSEFKHDANQTRSASGSKTLKPDEIEFSKSGLKQANGRSVVKTVRFAVMGNITPVSSPSSATDMETTSRPSNPCLRSEISRRLNGSFVYLADEKTPKPLRDDFSSNQSSRIQILIAPVTNEKKKGGNKKKVRFEVEEKTEEEMPIPSNDCPEMENITDHICRFEI